MFTVSSESAGILLGLLLVTSCDAEPTPLGPCDGLPEGRIDFAKDEAVHPNAPMEWWYWTGHLQDVEGRWFGFEQTFFHLQTPELLASMVHFAITDIEDQSFHYVVHYGSDLADQPKRGFDFLIREQSAHGVDGHDVLHGQVDNYVLDVDLRGMKKPVLQHEDGYTDYSFGGNTYYYSRERMAATATLQIGGDTVELSGEGWFDHQWGEMGSVVNRGWDWFAVQLDDNVEIMVFIARNEGADVMVGGSITDSDCHTREIPAEEVEVESHGTWQSPHTGCLYPQNWTLLIDGMEIHLDAVLDDQEVVSFAPTYWEGAVTVSGDATGRGYVELNGYCN
ncbi:MAG: hypothetical protein A2289_02310 [Deltaproteobacteria bacterium RIFOXYA12_FULL_58_15]|nr:MAG: hypothetical protein A2289_02310 [Deltaproteobacteria bacterium RIFOXYA12_FULL_58_15]OGR11505.1 MAG: hypothetical protein A2341_28440 [Deltaproteobacteria bacterium RIFOXYB12_FULL_58_9]